MHGPIRVSLLGQNAIVREGLRRILFDEGFDVRQSVDDRFCLSDEATRDDLLILVDGDRGIGGMGAVGALRERFPAAKLVILSDAFDFDAVVEAFRAGICGYIIKEISCEPLMASLRLVAMGEKVMPSPLAEALQLHAQTDEREGGRLILDSAHLSGRENEILSWLIAGCSNKAISRQLAISEATVKVHVKAILRKLRVRNRTQAAIRGVHAGMENHLDDPSIILALERDGPSAWAPKVASATGQ